MRGDKNIVYIFKKNNPQLKHLEGTYCEIVNKESDYGQGAISVQPIGSVNNSKQRVVCPGDYVKLRKEYLGRYMTFLLNGLERAERSRDFLEYFAPMDNKRHYFKLF